jgi:hypothetical protein
MRKVVTTRFLSAIGFVVILGGISAAQDTNFTNGPQYLIAGQSPMFFHSIETPSLSFGPSSAVAPPVTTENVEASQVVETPPSTPSGVDLTKIYWGKPETAANTGETEASGVETTSEIRTSQVQTSQAQTSEVQISGRQPTQPLPASLFDTGVTAMADAEFLREEGYGTSLAESAAYWKAHQSQPVRTFTNKDVEHAPGS